MPLLGKFSRGSSANPQTSTNSQTNNGYQSTLRGPKPPTTGQSYGFSPFGSSQSTPSAQTSNSPNLNYPRKSSRSPSSFLPIYSRKTTTQNSPPPATTQQPPPTSQMQTVPFTTQPHKATTTSTSVPILETRAVDASRPPTSTSTWRNFFSRSSSREKPQSNTTTSGAARPPSSSRVPSNESLTAGSRAKRQRGREDRVFEGVHETKSSAVRPAYASSGSKTSLTSGSVPSLASDVGTISKFIFCRYLTKHSS